MKREFSSFPSSAKLFLMSQFLVAGYYTWPFWYGFASERITASQFGIYLAIIYVTTLLLEVPSGAFADKFGRRFSAMIGTFATALVPLIVFTGSGFLSYIIAAVISGIGSAFTSGSLESLVYDLPEIDRETYRRVMIHEAFFFQAGLIVSSASGGLLYSINDVFPFIAQFMSFIAAFIIILKMGSDKERIKQTNEISATINQQSIKSYLSVIKQGFMHLFTIPLIRPLIIFGCTLGVLMWMGVEYINEAAMINYGLLPGTRGLIIAGTKVLVLILLNGLIIKRLSSDKQKMTYLVCTTMLVFLLYSFGLKSLFLIGFLGFNLISSINGNLIRPMIHDHIDSKWRATSISTYSFLSSLIQAIVSIVVGYTLQSQGVVFVQRALLAMFIIVAIPSALSYMLRLSAINTQHSIW